MIQKLISAIGLPFLLSTLEGVFSKDEGASKTALKIKEIKEQIEQRPDLESAFLNDLALSENAQIIEASLKEKLINEIHETYRRELSSGDKFISRMRPTFGYVLALSWALQMGIIAYVLMHDPDKAASIIESFGALTTMWSVALSVLGVYVYKRSQEKQDVNTSLKDKIPSYIKKIFS